MTEPKSQAVPIQGLLDRLRAGDELAREELLRGQVDAMQGMAGILHDSHKSDLESTLVPLAVPGETPTAVASVPAMPTSQRIGGYEVLGELGRGGMGVVYKARQISLNRLVALKVLQVGPEAWSSDLARFRTEAEAIASLQHPNIVQIFEVGEYQGMMCLALELVEGGNLGQYLRERSLAPAEAARLIETLARAIHTVHLAGVVHRDLKPANVLLAVPRIAEQAESSEGRLKPENQDSGSTTSPGNLFPKITDFGLAKRLSAGPGITVSGAILGTPSYMAPEQASGHPVGPAADIHGLGAIFYECLTGTPPYRGETVWDTLRLVITSEPISPRSLRPEIPADLATVCLKCLEKSPAGRYATALELADDLGRYLAGEPIHARPVGLVERAIKWTRRKPGSAALLAVTLLALLAVVVGGIIHHFRLGHALLQAQASSEEARQNLVWLHVSQGGRYLDEGDWFAALLWFTEALRLDQGHPEREHMHRLRIAAVLDHSPTLVRAWQHAGSVQHACFSPDGTRVLTVSEDCTACIRAVPTGMVIGTPLRHQAAVLYGAFSPDGKTVATSSQDGSVILWRVADGQPRALLGKHEGPVGLVVFSPDGKRLVSTSSDRTARLWDCATGKQLFVLRHEGAVLHASFNRGGNWVATADAEGMVRVWDIAEGKIVASMVGHRGPVFVACFHPDGRRVVTAGGDGTARLWEVETARQVTTAFKHRDAVVGASFSPDGERLLTASDDGTACVWNLVTRELLVSLRHASALTGASFGAVGRRIITGSEDNTARIWDADSGLPVTPLLRHSGTVHSVALGLHGRWAITAGNDGAVYLWDLPHAARPPSKFAPGPDPDMPRQERSSRGPWRSPDGFWLVSAEGCHSAQVRDAATGTPCGPPLRHGSAVLFASFSADSQQLVTTSDDNTARVWDVQTGKMLAPPLRLVGTVRRAAFSPDGRLIVTGGNRMARVWDASTGEPITPPLNCPGLVRDVEFIPDGSGVRVTSTTGMSNTWRLRADPRPLADLLPLAQVLASGRIDPKDGFLPLWPDELRAGWEPLLPRRSAESD